MADVKAPKWETPMSRNPLKSKQRVLIPRRIHDEKEDDSNLVMPGLSSEAYETTINFKNTGRNVAWKRFSGGVTLQVYENDPLARSAYSGDFKFSSDHKVTGFSDDS